MDIAHYSMRLKVKHISLTSNNAVLGFLYKNPTYLRRQVGGECTLLLTQNHYEKDKPTYLHRRVG
jgi:hypothetical protein